MSAEANAVVEAQPQTQEVVAVGVKTKKDKSSGNLILDIAHEVEGLTKEKALKEARKLTDDIEVEYLKLGGVLKLINDNSWFEGFASFDEFVLEQFGFASRKARYLIAIYTNLVEKQIPWNVVQHLGWSKLKDLAPVLTPENVDEWVKKAENLTVAELQQLLKGATDTGSKDTTVKTNDEASVKMNFKLKADQADVVTQAIAKAKGELHTEFDSVALENICSAFVGGVTQIAAAVDMDTFIKQTGFEPLLQRLSQLYPEFDIDVKLAGEATA